MTSNQATERALKRVKPDATPAEALYLRAALAVHLNSALEEVGKLIEASDGFEGLQKDFSAVPVAGIVDLTSLTGILFNIKRARVRISSSNLSLQAIDSIETLERGSLPLDQVFYAQDGTDLRFRDTSGSTVAYTTAVKIRSNYVPLITDIPTQYEETLVSVLADLGSKMPEIKREVVEEGRA